MPTISRLSMQGFKSFRNKTAIPLFPGFNAVIGPNGCGKTNVLDSLCFVLGKSSKNLRAVKLEKLIFSGWPATPPLVIQPSESATVSVTITLDGVQLPGIDPDADSIEISRHISRSGISTYKINGRSVNKTRVSDLFYAMKIDPESHGIIQQGDVNRLIDMKPKERRIIIDEIAGIREYNIKKESALKELEAAELKISESRLVYDQKKEFLIRLEKEKIAFDKYDALEKEQDYLRACIAHTRVNAVRSTMENIDRNLAIKEQEVKAAESGVGKEDKTLDGMEEKLRKINRDILEKSINAKTRKEIEDISSRIMEKEGDIKAGEREADSISEIIERLGKIQERQGLDAENHAVRNILNAPIEGVLGTIGSLGRVDSKYETAMDVAMGGRANDVVVETEACAITCIDHLKRSGLGRVRFLPLDRLRPSPQSAKAEIAKSMPGIVDFAIELVDFEPRYKLAFEQVLRDTLVAEDVESARKVRGLRVVTLEGELFDAGGAITGGTLKKRSGRIRTADVTDIRDYQRRLSKIEDDVRRAKSDIAEMEKLLNEKKNSSKKDTKEVEKLEKERDDLDHELEEKRRGRRGASEKCIMLKTDLENIRVRRAHLEAELENLMLDYEKYKDKQGLIKIDVEDSERKLRELARKMRDLGPINMKAKQEYDEFSRDCKEFEEKMSKLLEEKEAIMAMIEGIEERRKKVFNDAFTAVAREFMQVFRDLMHGEGTLSLENPKDIESGLLICARPKDKVATIDSLSGGEKTMTALAFLFAIQRYKPQPFYILDEVDAALDPENAKKVGLLVKEYSMSSQFIVISHNEVTVSHAERIYGVAMQKGVSQVLGVELGKERGYVESEGGKAEKSESGKGEKSSKENGGNDQGSRAQGTKQDREKGARQQGAVTGKGAAASAKKGA